MINEVARVVLTDPVNVSYLCGYVLYGRMNGAPSHSVRSNLPPAHPLHHFFFFLFLRLAYVR